MISESNKPEIVTTKLAVLGLVIVKLREKRSPPIMQLELAEMMGVSASSWSRIEKGETQLTASQLRDLAKIFSVSCDRLFELADEEEVILKNSGVNVMTSEEFKKIAKAVSEAGIGVSIVGALAAGGVFPLFGAALIGYSAYKILSEIEKEK